MIPTFFLIGHWAVVVILVIRVIMRRRPVGVSLSWIALILGLPVIGVIVYLVIGENRLGHTRARRVEELREPVSRWLMTVSSESDVDWADCHPACRALERQAANVVGIPALAHNKLQLIENSDETLVSIIRDIDAATETVHLEFYIWAGGGRGDEAVEAVIRAVDRGVRVRILIDAAGSKEFLRSRAAARMRAAGAMVVAALPVGVTRAFLRRMDVRMHRKIVVIDGSIAYTGSLNLADARFFKAGAGVGHWVDAMVRIEGPAVEALAIVFLADWHVEGAESLDEIRETSGMRSVEDCGSAAVQVVPSGPRRAPAAIHQMILTSIYSARRELVLTTPYFAPDEATMTALVSAVARGVEVTVVVPERVDSLLVRYASRSHFDDLLRAGVRIVQYRTGLLHAKTVTIDRSIALIGSVNLDMRSFWLNFEITLFVYDQEFSSTLYATQARYIEQSTELDLETWEKRSNLAKLCENVVRLAGPVL